ncbi:MAG: hypothetical protein WCL50_13095, partial [Spirochaetota bacterium]
PVLSLAWGPSSSTGSLELSTGQGRTTRIQHGPGPGNLVVPLVFFPAGSGRIELKSPSELRVLRCAVTMLPLAEAESLDLGVILFLPPDKTQADFEVYRWDLRPEVLVLYFADYAAQDRALKRLAFFVEKLGFKGRLAPDAEIASLHGWNAHDYRAADLARFFEKARKTSFQLGEPEVRLGKLLLDRGLIRKENGSIVAGRGALISISRESPAWLRTTFATHESSHALYFTDPDFADFVRRTWSSVGREERWFWKLYFGWMNYDTSNDDLMANEFMAYLFQQPVSKVEEYFTKTLSARVLENHKELVPRMEAWISTWGGSFTQHATAIEQWLKEHYGMVAGRSYFVY